LGTHTHTLSLSLSSGYHRFRDHLDVELIRLDEYIHTMVENGLPISSDGEWTPPDFEGCRELVDCMCTTHGNTTVTPL
jgi:hypothetical protein